MSTRMEWEKPYIEALIDTLRPFGEVLEVGFSQGYAANKIHSFPIKHHIIIESDPEVAKEAIKWANVHPNVTVIEAPWLNVLPTLGVFDAIFFNEFSLDRLPSIQPQGIENLVLQRGKEVLAMVEKELPQLKTIRYSDHDLDEFYQAVG
ncbi:MAG TPA: class I SAM-dependent methyltransferase, partial [Rhabdochlamydiaceae bacterium]|nr:class I SAM-dependent methyltransferase [Rhabdochlamydiaceae bacterium]